MSVGRNIFQWWTYFSLDRGALDMLPSKRNNAGVASHTAEILSFELRIEAQVGGIPG
jgi:hypothetical protein